MRDAYTPLYALPVAALLLVDRGQAERAVEVYALAYRFGFVANSRLWEDVAAAQERGRARELWATVEELLDEMRG